MKLAIFASRKTHLRYAKILAKFMLDEHGLMLSILWYKDLAKGMWAISSVIKPPSEELNQIINNYYRTKANRDITKKASSPVRLAALFKMLQAKMLFKTYASAYQKKGITHLLIWNGLKYRQMIAVLAAKNLNIKCLFIERGAFPGTTTLDSSGINYLNSVPRSIKFYRSYLAKVNAPHLYNASARPKELPEKYIFVPFQVNTDSQIVLFSPWIRNMFCLVEYIMQVVKEEESIPDVVFKPHPSCPQDYTELEKRVKSECNKIKFIRNIPIHDLIKHAEAVVTVNSSVGMEAILMRKKVIVLGEAFYGIEDITLQASSPETLKSSLLQIDKWTPDSECTDNFLSYLEGEYVVQGSWHKPDKEHLSSMSSRLIDLAHD